MYVRVQKVTLGPLGRNVVLSREGSNSVQIVNDGVTIAKEIDLANPELNVGVKLIQEVARKSGKLAIYSTSSSDEMHLISR